MSLHHCLLVFIASLFAYVQAAPFQKRAFSNGPVIAENFPDPGFIEVENGFYAFATTSGGRNVPTAYSTDFASWAVIDQDALPVLPSWGTAPIWAPDVIQRVSLPSPAARAYTEHSLQPDGVFVLYYTALSKQDANRHCVGTATANEVAGPYTPTADPLACPLAEGGAIDPAGFIDTDGTIYAVYKIDSNSLGGGGACGNGNLARDTPIMLQQLASDGITPVGSPTKILSRSQYDGPLIEAPSLMRSEDGTYVVFFSSNCFNGPYYDVSYATAPAVGGPYTKSPKPLLVSGDNRGTLNSPGGADVGQDGKRLVFHADREPANAGVRQMWTVDIYVQGGVVYLIAPPAAASVDTS